MPATWASFPCLAWQHEEGCSGATPRGAVPRFIYHSWCYFCRRMRPLYWILGSLTAKPESELMQLFVIGKLMEIRGPQQSLKAWRDDKTLMMFCSLICISVFLKLLISTLFSWWFSRETMKCFFCAVFCWNKLLSNNKRKAMRENWFYLGCKICVWLMPTGSIRLLIAEDIFSLKMHWTKHETWYRIQLEYILVLFAQFLSE